MFTYSNVWHNITIQSLTCSPTAMHGTTQISSYMFTYSDIWHNITIQSLTCSSSDVWLNINIHLIMCSPTEIYSTATCISVYDMTMSKHICQQFSFNVWISSEAIKLMGHRIVLIIISLKMSYVKNKYNLQFLTIVLPITWIFYLHANFLYLKSCPANLTFNVLTSHNFPLYPSWQWHRNLLSRSMHCFVPSGLHGSLRHSSISASHCRPATQRTL